MLPPELSALMAAADPAARESAWARFVETHSRLLLQVARSIDADHDAAMDAYAHLLEQLQAEDLRRLRAFVADDRAKFTTWLVIVARRLCLDHIRHRYGRVQSETDQSRDAHNARRRLLDHLAEEIDVGEVSEEGAEDAEARLRSAQLMEALGAALAAIAPADRLLLKLRFEDELSAREIAGMLKAPTPFHIYRRLNAVLEALREDLIRRGVRDAEP